MDIRAKQAGRFVKGFVSEGAEISVGAELYELDSDASGSEEASSSAASTDSPAAPLSEKTKESTDSASSHDASESSATKESESNQPSKASSGSNIEVRVPIMGESITTGMLASWLKNKGITLPLSFGGESME